MHNLFLVAGGVSPSVRWQDAFVDGVYFTRDVAVSARVKPDVLWLSAAAQGWRELLVETLQQYPDVPVVVVSNIPDEREAMTAMTTGARGYCHAWSSPDQFREVAQVVNRGGYWVGQALMSRLIGIVNKVLPPAETLPAELSEREAEVAREVVAGRSNKEVALTLGITERTVKAHLGAVFTKLGVRDRLQLVLRLTGIQAEK